MNKLFLVLLFVVGLLVFGYFFNFDNKSAFFNGSKMPFLNLQKTKTVIVPNENFELLSFVIPTEEKVVSVPEKYNPCKQTIYYSFGNIDSRHDISPKKLREIMKKVESVWEKPTGLNLFDYKEEAPFKINFIFDERQERSNATKNIDKNLITLKNIHSATSGEYKTLVNKYNHSLEKYLKRKKKLEKDAEKYEQEVAYWNKNGHIAEEQYNDLERTRSKLLEQQEDLNTRVKKLNKLAKKINSLTKKDVRVTKKYNSAVMTYTKKYGSSTTFNQGEFFGKGINIYEFKDEPDLILVLAHEFGHALGIKHLKNHSSIMYYLVGEQDLNNIHPTREDLVALNNLCR